MDIRSLADSAIETTVNPNIPVTLRISTGFTVGAAYRQVPEYAPDVTGVAQIQALDGADLRQLDNLNLQGVYRTIFVRGALAGLIRPDSKGGDLVIIPAAAGTAPALVGTWLITKVFESWTYWTKAVICKQENP